MGYLIAFLLTLSIVHFIYDGIILPSIRQHLRNKLFALRDELRWEKIKGIQKQDTRAFHLLHDAINNYVNRLPMLTISVKLAFERELRTNTLLNDSVQQSIVVVENCSNNHIIKIYREINDVLESAFIANSAGWLAYILPIIIAASVIKKLSELSTKITVIPQPIVKKLIPQVTH